MTLEEIPDGLHAVQLARKICEDTCGFPATQGNLTLIADCITAIGKKLFQGRPDAEKMACFVLTRRVETAQKQGIKVSTHWFRNGEYWEVEREQKLPAAPRYEHHGEGYGEADIKFLIREWVKAGDKRTESGWYEAKLNELDKKRGRAPEFRR